MRGSWNMKHIGLCLLFYSYSFICIATIAPQVLNIYLLYMC